MMPISTEHQPLTFDLAKAIKEHGRKSRPHSFIIRLKSARFQVLKPYFVEAWSFPPGDF